ncbi:MAG: MFS transporter [Acidimicrobiales bacterium]
MGEQRIPRHLRILLGANFASDIGSGLTLPFLLIYLHEVRHIPLGITGLLIGASSVVGVPAGPLVGTLVDKLGPRVVSMTVIAIQSLGTIALLFVHSALSAIPVMCLYGVAQGAVWPAWNALFAVMVHDEQLRPKVFARSFQLLNLGLGIGSVIAGLLVHVGNPSSFTKIYLVDGLSDLVIVVALGVLPAAVFARSTLRDDAPAHPRGGYREVLSDRRFLRYLVAMTFLASAGYAAVSTGLVGYATTVVHVGPRTIAWAFALNTGLIVLLQSFALRTTSRMRRTTALSICAAFFGAAWVVLGVSGIFPSSLLGNWLVISMFGVFAMGEVLLAPVAAPLVTMMARPSLQGRYSALSSSIYSVTSVIGPAIAGVMLGARLRDEYLGLLVACSVAAVFSFRWLRGSLGEGLDNAPRSRATNEPEKAGVSS